MMVFQWLPSSDRSKTMPYFKAENVLEDRFVKVRDLLNFRKLFFIKNISLGVPQGLIASEACIKVTVASVCGICSPERGQLFQLFQLLQLFQNFTIKMVSNYLKK